MHIRLLAAAIPAAFLVACTTTQDASKAMKSRWIGQSSDAFFSQHGAPISVFPLQSGAQLYRWRGGETVRVIPAQYKTVTPAPAAAQPLYAKQQVNTTVTQPDANTTVTRTTTTGVTIAAPTAQPQQVLVSPERRETLFCEAQITVDPSGVIANVEPTRDTVGAGAFSLSRCAEVFGAG